MLSLSFEIGNVRIYLLERFINRDLPCAELIKLLFMGVDPVSQHAHLIFPLPFYETSLSDPPFIREVTSLLERVHLLVSWGLSRRHLVSRGLAGRRLISRPSLDARSLSGCRAGTVLIYKMVRVEIGYMGHTSTSFNYSSLYSCTYVYLLFYLVGLGQTPLSGLSNDPREVFPRPSPIPGRAAAFQNFLRSPNFPPRDFRVKPGSRYWVPCVSL